MRWLLAAPLAVLALMPVQIGCDAGGGEEGPSGNLEYYCLGWSAAWCPAYRECDPFGFPLAFTSETECIEHSVEDCLDPPGGAEPCSGATEEETDLCVEYLESNHPDGCDRLFGVSADMTPCEEICD
jgi:hypothetical protein